MTHALRLTEGHRPMMFVDSGGCWVWLGYTSGSNLKYGRWGKCDEWRSKPAHKAVWEMFNGPIPDGLQLDHLCNNTICINPAHVQATTTRVNTLRGNNPAAVNARRTHCKKGHSLADAYIYRKRDGRPYRSCRECGRKLHRRKHGTATH